MENSPALELVGAVFNRRWRLARLLGEGGMGAVYEAQGINGEGQRAIKVLHPEFATEEQVLSRFFAEAEAVRALAHPNVCQIFDTGRAEDGTPYLLMEMMHGMPLSALGKPGQPVPAHVVVPLVIAVLGALAVAHQRGIVHRDLKPDNLFVVGDGRGGQTAKVLDFGIAKVMDGAGGMGSKTKTGVLLGTPGYMSPEQIKNSKSVDPRSDLWSMGIILYELLSGKQAYEADNEFTRLTMVLTQDVRPIGEVAPQLAAWNGFFLRALARDLDKRFQSSQEMAHALQQMIGAPASREAPPPATRAPNKGTVALSMPQPPSAQAPMPPGPTTMGSPMHAQAATPQHAQPMSAPYGQPSQQLPSQPMQHGSVPPASMQQGPNTMSVPRAPGVPTLATGAGPSVPVMSAPPVGVPWWVVIAVGGACLVVGFLVGYAVG